MKKYVGAAIATALLAGTAFAAAPSTSAPPSPPAAGAEASFTLPSADAMKLKDWILAQTAPSATPPAGFNVAVGEALPAGIMLAHIEAAAGVPSATMYDFAKLGDQIVLVNPTDRKIVYVFS
jgi:hypothetical protein